MTDIDSLIEGYRRFHQKHFVDDGALYKDLAIHGQSPETLVIACSDSRVDPTIVTNAGPGDLFVIRNVANLVPPYSPTKGSYHGTSAALEFAVCGLKVKNIVIMGHSRCAGIQALMEQKGPLPESSDFSFVQEWVKIAKPAQEKVEKENPDASPGEKNACCEKEGILLSMQNLLSFPWLKERYDAGELKIYGCYFSVFTGLLEYYDPEKKAFITLE